MNYFCRSFGLSFLLPLSRYMYMFQCDRWWWCKVLFLWYFSMLRLFCAAITFSLDSGGGDDGTKTTFVSGCLLVLGA